MATRTKIHVTTFIGFLLLISLFHSRQVSASRSRTKNSSLPYPISPSSVSSSCASSPLPQGGLKISHRYGPCSINSLYTSAAGNNYALDYSDHGEGIVAPTFGADGNYLVTVGLGTPRRDFNLMLDTGSELSWVKCQIGDEVFFNPAASSTFETINCHPDDCNFSMRYLDGSISTGYRVKDKLTISTDEFSGFTFGCSQNSTGNFGKAAGILALGQSTSDALVSQTSSLYGGIFCYCLPTRDNPNGYLLFGKGAINYCRRSNNKFTALVSNPRNPNQYFVNFNGITIGRVRINFGGSDSSPGTFVDSGTIITKLPADVYETLKAEFVNCSMGAYNFTAAEAEDKLDTCYNVGQGNFDDSMVPEVVLHFGDMDLGLGPSAVVWRGNEKVCLAFAAKDEENGSNIIGNYQQRGLNVLYDGQYNRLEMGPGSCGN